MKFKSFAEMLQKLPDDQSCREYLELVRWSDGQTCAHCKNTKSYKLKIPGLYKCASCKKRYNVATGTMLEGSHIGYRLWFIAIYIFQSHKKGISSHQLAKDLGVTQKTGWFMLHRIRHAMQEQEIERLTGTVQLDETFVGGKNKNRHQDKKIANSQGRSFKDKTPIFGMFQQAQTHAILRQNKNNPNKTIVELIVDKPAKVRCQVVPDTKNKSLFPVIIKNVDQTATVVSDEWMAYNSLNVFYEHEIVDHHRGQYVNDNGLTTNGLEGFWTWFKRTYHGTYHKLSAKHMQSYANEVAFRYNYLRTKETERFNIVLGANNGRLFYKQLVKRRA